MKYQQIASSKRYLMAARRRQGYSQAEIARHLGRARSTISREVRRNHCTRDNSYRASKADSRAVARRRRSRRNQQFTAEDYAIVERHLRFDWSPEQVAGHLRREGLLSISHETIYLHIWRDKKTGGSLWTHLRGARKKRRKRYAAYDSRGRLAGERHISERAAVVETRSQVGHWQIDTVMGNDRARHSIVSIVERATGYLLIGKLALHTAAETTRRCVELIDQHPERFATITADNGTEFHSYKDIEAATDVEFYFATPHHAWERGTCENTNGLIRQYLPKGVSMAGLTQEGCDAIAATLNTRPRKRLGLRTPEACYAIG